MSNNSKISIREYYWCSAAAAEEVVSQLLMSKLGQIPSREIVAALLALCQTQPMRTTGPSVPYLCLEMAARRLPIEKVALGRPLEPA